MKRNLATIATNSLLVVLVCILGAAAFTVHAFQVDGTHSSTTGAAVQACYTLDTSRPEWLATSPVVYLPFVLKNHVP